MVMTYPFEVVTVAMPEALAADGAIAPFAGGVRVPRELFGGSVFRADRFLSRIDRPDGTPLLRFGTAGLSYALCVDPASGGIVGVWDEEASIVVARRPDWIESFINSDAERFVETARAVTARFPYYLRSAFDSDDGYASVKATHDELIAAIAAIDAPAAIPDRFWSTFTDDVLIGDFATEDIVSLPRHATE
jgi:hypothetical protein